jgi:LPXTG-motif cell wall-anchored protein
MKSRIVILSMLVLGMLLSTAGAGLAITGLTGQDNASVEQYGTPTPTATTTPTGGGNVLGDEDSGNNVLPSDENGGGSSPGGGSGNAVQPARQVEAGANNKSTLPYTGFAAVPILLGGIALLSAGLVLRRRTGEQR